MSTATGTPPTTVSSFTYVLNPNGDRTQVTDTTGVTSYRYDALSRLASVTYPGPTTTAYTYDGVGNRKTQQVDANPATTYTYDEADELTQISGVTGTNPYDKTGNMLRVGSYAKADSFMYDPERRLFRTGQCRSDVNDDGSSNALDQGRIAAHYGAEGTAAYDVLEDVNSDGNINSIDLQQQAQEFGTCAATGPNTGNGRYSYNGDGLRIHSRTFGPVANDDFVWDLGSSLPVVLQDVKTQGGAATTTTFLYGLGLISATDSGGATSYYLSDGLGSTTQLTDSAGAVSESYTYDVFGARKTATEPSVNAFRYTGQQDDRNANRGLYYLRARFYDPALGRFLTRDPLGSGNPYTYANANPVNYVDPSGLFCIGPKKVCENVGDATDAVVAKAARVADKLGYLDANFTACPPLGRLNVGPCVTGGVQWQIGSASLHPYVGAGVGTSGFSGAVTWAPLQQVNQGWACGAQASGGGWAYNFGHPVTGDKEGWGFVEFGAGVGTGGNATCFYVF